MKVAEFPAAVRTGAEIGVGLGSLTVLPGTLAYVLMPGPEPYLAQVVKSGANDEFNKVGVENCRSPFALHAPLYPTGKPLSKYLPS